MKQFIMARSLRSSFLRVKSAFNLLIVQNNTLRVYKRTHGTKNILKAVEMDIDGKLLSLNAVWLRENCQCDVCYTRSTNQRHVLFNKLKPEDFKLKQQEKVGDNYRITWSDGHVSTYHSAWLNSNLFPSKISPNCNFSIVMY